MKKPRFGQVTVWASPTLRLMLALVACGACSSSIEDKAGKPGADASDTGEMGDFDVGADGAPDADSDAGAQAPDADVITDTGGDAVDIGAEAGVDAAEAGLASDTGHQGDPDVGGLPVVQGVESAGIRVIGGTPVLHVNDAPYNPLMYFAGPHRITSTRDGGYANAMTAAQWISSRPKTLHTFELAARKGVHLLSFDVWLPWARPGQPANYADTDAAIAAVLARDPDGILLLRFTMDPPAWWREAHPTELMQWQRPDGSLTNQLENEQHYSGGTVVSVASELWRTEASEQLTQFIRHLESTPNGRRIMGYHFCGQNSHEWFTMGARADNLANREPVFTTSWRRWLREKYGTVAQLRAAWSDPQATFAAAAAPTQSELLHGTVGYFRDPSREQRIIDFHEYQSVATVEALEQFGGVVKRESTKLSVAFYGYLFEHSNMRHGAQQSGHLALGRLLKSDNIDAIASPMGYNSFGAGYNSRMKGGIAAFMTTVDSVSLNGKLWYNEDDTRTHLTTESGRPKANSLQETISFHQRNFSHLFARGMSCWWMDLGGTGWLDDVGIWDNLGALTEYYGRHFARGIRFNPEIAVIADEKSLYAMGQAPQEVTGQLLAQMREPLYRVGAPMGFYQLGDLVAGRIPPKKLYVFLNNFVLTNADRAAISSQCAGKTCVFMYANGLINRTVEASNMNSMLNTTAVEISSGPQSGRCQARSHALTRDVSTFGVGELNPAITLDETIATSEGIEILAEYAASGRPAAWKHSGAYTSIYIGAVNLPPAFLRSIALASGVHIYTAGNDVIDATDQFFSIHAASTGTKVIRLPRPAIVREALTDVLVGGAIDTWSVDMQLGETRLYSLTY